MLVAHPYLKFGQEPPPPGVIVYLMQEEFFSFTKSLEMFFESAVWPMRPFSVLPHSELTSYLSSN